MSDIDYESEEELVESMLKLDIKQDTIFCDMDYEDLRCEIMKGSLSVNTHIKLKSLYHLNYFKKVGITEIYDLTILHLAVCLEDEQFVDFLLEKNADVTIATGHVGPVIYSMIRWNKLEYVRKLVDAGASVNKSFCLKGLELDEVFLRDDSGTTSYREYRYDDYSPLQFAIKMRSYHITEFLLSRNADVNYKGSIDIPPPFNLAVELECKNEEDEFNVIQILELLIAYGADINMVAADGYQKTPLLKAAVNPKSIFLIEFLLNQPTINLNAVDNHKRSCLHLFFMASGDHLDMTSFFATLDLILVTGIDINLVDDDQKLAIDMISDEARKNCIKMVKINAVAKIAADFYVSPRIVPALIDPEFENFHVYCTQEINRLKKTKDFITGFLYYDLLHKSLHKIALRLKNRTFYLDDELTSRFSTYGGMIISRLIKANQRLELFNNVENVLYEIFYKDLPAIFIHDLFFYLSNADLWKLSRNY